MTYEKILLTRDNGLATITLNAPDRLNAVSRKMISEIKQCWEELAADDSVRAVLLTGAGRGFCAGADLADPDREASATADSGAALDKFFNPVIRAMRTIPKPVVSAVNGVAAGVGMSFALASDIAIAGKSASFLQAFARIGLLCSIFWLMQLTKPLLEVAGRSISGKDMVLIAGGLFLLWKSVHEIHGSLEEPDERPHAGGHAKLASVIGQILVIDIVFSLDSVITAVGLVQEVSVMIAAVVIALGIMLFAAKPIGDFVNRHPSVKMLALAFLLMVGLMLVAEGMGQHIPKGYIYFAMAFSFGVEMLNLRARSSEK